MLTISVITPSFNQAEFLPECLDSVAAQSCRPLEHLVFDPGSKDESRAIAARFKEATLIAEPDQGQSDAVNKGFSRARGDLLGWVNSDDCFIGPQVFEMILRRFEEPDAPDIVYGKGIYINEKGEKLRDVYINKKPDTLPWRLQQEDGILQPALFMRKSVYEKVGPLSAHLHYCMDYEYWIRCVKAGVRFVYLDVDLAKARYHIHNKTYGMRAHSYREVCDMLLKQFGYANHMWLRRYAEFNTDNLDGVLAHAQNREVKSKEALAGEYRRLLRDYNSGVLTYAIVSERKGEQGYGDTWREMDKEGVKPSTPCRLVPLDCKFEAGHVLYTVGPRRWAFQSKWKQEQIAKAHAFLRQAIQDRKRDACVIVGNGPSLAKTNLSLLRGQDVIVSNNAFLSPELMGLATYYTVVNYLVAEQGYPHINRIQSARKILPYWLSYCLNEDPYTFFVDAVGYPEFSTDMFKNMSWRHTVSFFNLHLAYGLGYRKVILVGFDHAYKQAAAVREGEVIRQDDVDENHFHGEYFRGKEWQAADCNQMENMYRLAQAAYEADGRQIVNATEGGRLELFPRASLEACMGGREPCASTKSK